MIEPGEGTTFHITLANPLQAIKLAQILSEAGVSTNDIRKTSNNYDGLIFTKALLHGEWNSITGKLSCEGECRTDNAAGTDAPVHTDFDDLSTDQQDLFGTTLSAFLHRMRNENFSLHRNPGPRFPASPSSIIRNTGCKNRRPEITCEGLLRQA